MYVVSHKKGLLNLFTAGDVSQEVSLGIVTIIHIICWNIELN